MAEIEFNGDIAQPGALHHERMVVLLDYATTHLRREGFGRPPRAKAGKLNLDPDPARDALGGLDERWQLKRRLSARGYHRVLRVARTLADLDGAERVRRIHVAEALSYRRPTVRRATPPEPKPHRQGACGPR